MRPLCSEDTGCVWAADPRRSLWRRLGLAVLGRLTQNDPDWSLSGNTSRRMPPAGGDATLHVMTSGLFIIWPQVTASHPQQRPLGVGVVLVTCRLHTLSDCFSQHALLFDLPQVLISLLTGLLHTDTHRHTHCQIDRQTGVQTDRLVFIQTGTWYSRCASSSRAPGAMEAILKISWQTRGTSWRSSWLEELITRTPSSSPTRTHGSSTGNLVSEVKVQTSRSVRTRIYRRASIRTQRTLTRPRTKTFWSHNTSLHWFSSVSSLNRFSSGSD